ncbi:CBS domain-containing protein [Embleya sp. NPDC056575]|uniref:CBS domain-containing protein n=1 Tax=unclassified Embleya TaxID=2699296 RepID=UPI0036CCA068
MTTPQLPTPEQLLALKGTTVMLPDFLALFGVRTRNYLTISPITTALKEVGLTTVPSFSTCGVKAALVVVAEESVVGAPDRDDVEEQYEEPLPGMLPQRSFKIGDIPSARNGVTSVGSGASLAQATHQMKTKNYCQLPVIDGISMIRGVVTWRSVAALYEQGSAPSLANAMVKDSLPIAEVHQEVFAHLASLSEYGYLLVRDNSGRFTGIITAVDIAARFEATALPFFLVGEIEFRLRQCLGAKLSPQAICAVQPNTPSKQTGKIADLMFGAYVKLLYADPKSPTLCARADANWAALGWGGVDRTQFVQHLDRVRVVRNQIAHFDSNPLTEQQILDLREFCGLLKQLT